MAEEKKRIKIAYCGFDMYANCLRLLLESCKAEVIRIFCGARGSGEVQALARERTIPFSCHPVSEKDLKELFERQGCDYVVSACYTWKYP
jgi:hypothetical protein